MLLKLGSNGEEVKELQTLLKINADGSFGPGTLAAVKAWQSANGLTADGIVGNATWSALHTTSEPTVPATPGTVKFSSLTGKVPASVLLLFPEYFAKYEINSRCNFR